MDEENEVYSDGDVEIDEASMFKILIATDIHLGFLEKHPTRGDDSFITFEEILKYGQTEEVDFVLLGGDLFHENKPSRKAVQRCMDLLRKYCLGPERNTFVFLSDPAVNFKDCSTPTVNFEDPNLRISLPIFSIHGNHDDPCGEGNYSVMDMLGASGLVNYFGKVPNLDKLTFQPLLFRKGDTCVAIYGIGSMNDDRLFRLFQEEKVFFEVPQEMEDDWFNILVLHQNRARHGCKSYAGEHFLPSFMHLVMWGHEHECRIDPEESLDDFRITQPGSSVATSLCPGEAKQKHVGILKVHKKEFCIDKLPLRTVRPFVFDTLSLDEFSDIGYQFVNDEVVDKIKTKIFDMLEGARKLNTGHPDQPTLPLLRLRVECENDQQFVNVRDLHAMLGFENSVANPEDIVKITKKRAPIDSIKQEVDEEAFDAVFNMETINMVEGHLENLLVEYYKESSKQPLIVMHERALAEAVRYYVDKHHDDAFRDLVHLQAVKTNEQLKDKQIGNERALFREAFEQLRLEREKDVQHVVDEAHSWLCGEVKIKREPSAADQTSNDHDMLSDGLNQSSSERVTPSATPTRGRGRGRGRAAKTTTATTTAGRGRGKSRAAAKQEQEDDIVIESDEEFSAPAKPAPKTTARSSRSARGSSRAAPATPGIVQMFAKQSQSMSSQRSSMSSALSSNVNAPVTSTPVTQSTPSSSRSSRKTANRGVCYVSDDSD